MSALRVLSAVGSDALSDSALAEVAGASSPVVMRALKASVAVDPKAFAEKSRRLSQVTHAALLVPQRCGTTADGRPFVLHERVTWQPLSSSRLETEALVVHGIAWCHALAALHAEGLAIGHLTPDLLLVEPPRIDATLAGLAMGGASAAADVKALVALLLQAGAGQADKSPFDTSVRQNLARATTADAAVEALEAVRMKWRARTEVKSGGRAVAPEVELDLTGRMLGAYLLERVIGEGAMGRVYLGKHHRIGRMAAVKVLKAEHARQADLVQRFIQEAQAVNAIKNEHIVEVYDFGEEVDPHGQPLVYCVMELLEGSALVDAMKQPLEVQRACRIAREVALALDAAHQVGVVHRDIKPENIFLHRRGADLEFVKVLDFGVAKLLKPLGDIPKSGTQAGMVIGTPEYMAPEQALGNNTDLRIDLYAVGLVLYELLAGTQPFHGDTFGKLVVEITTKPPPPLPAVTLRGEPISPALAQVVMRCLEKNPDARFASAAELAAALDAPTASSRTVVGAPLQLSAADDAAALAAIKPSPLPKVLGALVALAVVMGSALVFWPKPAVVTPPPPVVAVPTEPPKPVATTVHLAVLSAPPGATVLRADTSQALGVTPLDVEVAPLEKLAVELQLDGYQPARRDVALNSNVTLSVELAALPKPQEPAKDSKKPKANGKKGPVSRDGVVDPFAQ